MDSLPSVRDITKAHHWLEAAHRISVAFDVCGTALPSAGVYQSLYRSYMTQAAEALGYDLVPRPAPVLAIDNTNVVEVGPR